MATAVSLETVFMQVVKMIGPVLAGLGLARFGPAPCYVAVGGLYAGGLLVFMGLPARIGGPIGRDTASMAASLGVGFREAWGSPPCCRSSRARCCAWARSGLGALLGALAIATRRGFLPHGRLFALSVLVARRSCFSRTPACAGGRRAWPSSC